jgi:putative PIN family toxin of toxin-antitoxin system
VIRAVIDTNVFVSALISPSGNEALIVLAIRHGIIAPCYSADMLREYAEVLARPKFSFTADEIEGLVALLRSRGERVSPESFDPILPDPADDKFLACAQAARAHVIVTGNKRDFPRERCGGIDVLNAAELLDRMTRDA